MTDSENRLLAALAKMVDQYLDRYQDEVDSRAMSAGEHAIKALAEFGLMEVINTRFGRWTETGKRFIGGAGPPAKFSSYGTAVLARDEAAHRGGPQSKEKDDD
jgi:hypothetical protein